VPLIDYRISRPRIIRHARITAGLAPLQVTNRVWFISGNFEVRWQTATPDSVGASYPGPGTFGIDTTAYTVDDPCNVS